MRLIWAIIPLILFSIIGIQESFAEESEIIWENSVTTSNEKVKATLATDKKVYSEGEIIHIQWSLENLGTKDIFFKPIIIDSCRPEFYLEVFGGNDTMDNYGLNQLMPISGISSEDIVCLAVSYIPRVFPNEKIENKLSWTQDIVTDSASFDGMKQISPGYYTLRITYYESEQQYYDNTPEYLELQFNIKESIPEEITPELKTPKQQTNSGILPSKVECKAGLELIFKSTDGTPACVKPETKTKLIERGWASN